MSYIKRWAVTQQDGKSLNLYYRTFELAKQNNPNCTIVEYVNNDYLAYIDMIINQAVDHRIDYKGRHSYKINIPCLEEQEKIAVFLSNLQESAEKQKELTEEYKKMFNEISNQIFNGKLEI